MELIERIKAECKKHEDSCLGCLLHTENGCYCADYVPFGWDIEAIRKAFGETSDKASDKEEIVVPEMWKEEKFEEIPFGEPYNMVYDIMKKQNKIINCLEHIKERM